MAKGDVETGKLSDWTFPADEDHLDVGRIDADGAGSFVGLVMTGEDGTTHKIALHPRHAILVCRTAVQVALEILGKDAKTSGPVMN